MIDGTPVWTLVYRTPHCMRLSKDVKLIVCQQREIVWGVFPSGDGDVAPVPCPAPDLGGGVSFPGEMAAGIPQALNLETET